MADKDPGYSPFVNAVAGDGTTPPDVRVIVGWLGASGEEGYVRIYLSASLSTYVDVPRDAIVYSEEIPNSHPAGERMFWVKNDAELKEGGSAIARAAKFLFGQVQQDFAQGAGAAAAQPAVQPQAQHTQICLTFKPGCQPSVANPCITQTEMPNCHRLTRIPCSAIDACPSSLIECDTTAAQCPTASPCTCPGQPTVKWPQCDPSAVDACPTRLCLPQTESGPQCFGGIAARAAGRNVPAQNAGITGFCQPTGFCRITTTGPQCPHAQALGQQSTDFCPTSEGCTGAAASGPGWTCNCPPPPPHTGHPAITCGPCTGAANVGWTSAGCGTHTYYHYGCTGNVPCATCTVCWG